jgi:cytochrome P450
VSSLTVSAPRPPANTVQPPPRAALAHIPGDEGYPLVGNTLSVLANPKGFVERRAERYGLVYRTRMFGETSVSLLGPDANELVLLDPQKNFSSMLGWATILDRLFPRGLMLRDFDEHRLHRRALSVAFKAGPMKSYLEELNAGIAARIAEWPRRREMRFYPAIKQLTLDLAATSFLGTQMGPQMQGVSRAFIDMVAATVAPIRTPLPGTKMRRGVQGRAFMVDYFTRRIATARERGGDDLFSQLCRTSYEDGSLLSAPDIVDHMSFLMMAAHDTLTSSITTFVYQLASNPDWQTKLREEIGALKLAPDEPLRFEQLDAMTLTEMAFKEAMRITPPVPSIPRRALREFELKGFRIPAGAGVNINPLYTHHMPELWPEPARFDPTRFTDEAARRRHKFAFVPFGGGAHMCIGLNFAYMQAKCFARHFLGKVAVSIEPGYRPAWQMWPIPKPRDGLKVTLRAI